MSLLMLEILFVVIAVAAIAKRLSVLEEHFQRSTSVRDQRAAAAQQAATKHSNNPDNVYEMIWTR